VSGATVIGGVGDAVLEVNANARQGLFTGWAATQGVAANNDVVMAENSTSVATATIHGIWDTGNLVVGNAGHATVNVLGTQISQLNSNSVGRLTSDTVDIAAEPGS
jgi:hypothetical protein